jgi:hypothetical protein
MPHISIANDPALTLTTALALTLALPGDPVANKRLPNEVNSQV